MTPILTPAQLASLTGSEIGCSEWRTVTQDRVNDFAAATEDHQFIHVDPPRAARESHYKGTIAHGFLILSWLSSFSYEVLPVLHPRQTTINYGFDRIRFLSPVLVGSRVRARFELKELKARDASSHLMRCAVAVEIENHPTPAMVADWIILVNLPDDEASARV